MVASLIFKCKLLGRVKISSESAAVPNGNLAAGKDFCLVQPIPTITGLNLSYNAFALLIMSSSCQQLYFQIQHLWAQMFSDFHSLLLSLVVASPVILAYPVPLRPSPLVSRQTIGHGSPGQLGHGAQLSALKVGPRNSWAPVIYHPKRKSWNIATNKTSPAINSFHFFEALTIIVTRTM